MRTRIVGVVLEDSQALGRGVVEGVAEYGAAREDWLVQVVSSRQMAAGQYPTPDFADGLIGAIHDDVAALWDGPARKAIVNVSRGREIEGASNVTCDDRAIAEIAADFLLSKGVKGYAWCDPHLIDQRRRSFFVEKIEEAGHSVSLFDTHSDRKQRLAAKIEQAGLPCGVLAFNDLAAIEFLKFAREIGYEAPRDLAVVGVDNDVFRTQLSPVAVTSIDPDFKRVGYEAARALDRVFKGGEPRCDPLRIPPRGLIERHSSDFPGELDQVAVRAARLIRQRACEGASIPAILEELPASYRTVDRRFKQAFGHTLRQEIIEVRMAEAKRLLRQGTLSLEHVATRTGYATANYFNTAFRKHVGMPPGAYQKQHIDPTRH